MSIRQMTEVWDLDVSHPEQTVLLALADWSDDDGGHLFPSQEKLAWKTGYSVRQVRRIILDLRQAGGIEIVSQGTRGRTTQYQLRLDRLPRKPEFVSPDNMSGDPDLDHRTSTVDHRTSTVVSPDTDVPPIRQEPSVEPSTTSAALAARRRDPIWDVLVEIYGEPTSSGRGARNAAAKVLRDYGALPAEIFGFVTALAGSDREWAVTTPTALAKHYGERKALVAQAQNGHGTRAAERGRSITRLLGGRSFEEVFDLGR